MFPGQHGISLSPCCSCRVTPTPLPLLYKDCKDIYTSWRNWAIIMQTVWDYHPSARPSWLRGNWLRSNSQPKKYMNYVFPHKMLCDLVRKWHEVKGVWKESSNTVLGDHTLHFHEHTDVLYKAIVLITHGKLVQTLRDTKNICFMHCSVWHFGSN